MTINETIPRSVLNLREERSFITRQLIYNPRACIEAANLPEEAKDDSVQILRSLPFVMVITRGQ